MVNKFKNFIKLKIKNFIIDFILLFNPLRKKINLSLY